MDEAIQQSDSQVEAPPGSPAEPAQPIASRFLFVDIAALRAKQLRRGARVRIGEAPEHLPKKPERLAMEEVRRGLVSYNMPQPKAEATVGVAE